MGTLIQDLRYGLRMLARSPGFACTAIVMLALGGCASVAIFAFVDAALIKPLPYRDQSRLVAVFETAGTSSQSPVSYLDFLDWKSLNKVFSSIDAYALNGGFTLSTTEGAQQVTGTRVSAGFFRTLGVTPVLGRDFQDGENPPPTSHTVMLSYASWQKRFGGRRDALGQAVTLNGSPNIIIGVLPRDFHFAPAGAAEFWGTLHASDYCEQHRACHNLNTLARLKGRVSVQAALADLKPVMQQLDRQYPDTNADQGANVMFLSDVIVGGVRPILLVLLGGAGLLLLIACVNVTSLLLARSDSRKREIAVRGALGASRARLVRQFATEGLVLVGAGALLGLISADWVMQLLTRLIPTDMMGSMPYLQGLSLNFRVVAFAGAIALLAGVLFAITPISRVSLSDMQEGLAEGGRGSAGIVWRRFGSNLVVVELALAVVLLVGAGLLGKSLYRLLRVDIGMKADHLATLGIEGPSSRYAKDEQAIALERRVLDRIASLPGVKAVGIASALPVSSGWGTAWFQVVGRPSHGEHNEAYNRQVSSGYFTALQAPLLRGRYFSEAEDGSKPRVVIINRTLAKQYFPGEDPLGKQVFYSNWPQPPMEIVGVVGDIKEGPLDSETLPALYVPFNQNPSRGFAMVVRTSQAERSVLPTLVAAIHQIDPGISTSGEGTLSDTINDSPSAYLHRSSAWLVGGFAALALLLAGIGLYSVLAYSVTQRTREIGVRMALGARPGQALALVARESAAVVGVGLFLGLAGALATARLFASLLFEVAPADPLALLAALLVLGAVALLATLVPARRAALVDPAIALRAE